MLQHYAWGPFQTVNQQKAQKMQKNRDLNRSWKEHFVYSMTAETGRRNCIVLRQLGLLFCRFAHVLNGCKRVIATVDLKFTNIFVQYT